MTVNIPIVIGVNKYIENWMPWLNHKGKANLPPFPFFFFYFPKIPVNISGSIKTRESDTD